MSRRLAVVTALPVQRNPGMMSVDLALLSFLRRHKLDFEVTFYCVERVFKSIAAAGVKRLDYRQLEDPESLIRTHERVLFWGDFIHSRRYYQRDVIPRITSAGDTTSEQAESDLYERFLFERCDERDLARCIAFGGTIYINSIRDALTPRYVSALARLYKNCALVMMRDPVSASYVMDLTDYQKTSTLGIDCAFLLDSRDGLLDDPPFTLNPPGPYLGFFFGRSGHGEALAAFAQSVARQLGLPVIRIPWLDDHQQRVLTLAAKLKLLRYCAVVVTDTYHLTVTAWREGIPTICIGNGAQMPRGTLDDKKKELMYQMLGMREFYLFVEEVLNERRRERALLNACQHVQDRSVVEHVVRSIERRTRYAESALADALR